MTAYKVFSQRPSVYFDKAYHADFSYAGKIVADSSTEALTIAKERGIQHPAIQVPQQELDKIIAKGDFNSPDKAEK
jgi:hypothetical protein